MPKKQAGKRAFDWRTYSKPSRLLTPPQEEAFATGDLACVLAWAARDPRTRVEIRARAAGIYHRGVSIARVSGEGPFTTELEGDSSAEQQRGTLETSDAVGAFLDALDARRTSIDHALDTGQTRRTHRSYLSALASGNLGVDLFADEMVVVDSEYMTGKRKLDLVALVRPVGVVGPGGFANPSPAFIDVRSPERPLSGGNGLAETAADLAEYSKALSGQHRLHTQDEVVALAAQKVRLGLLPADLEVRSIADEMPFFIVAFCEKDPTDPSCDSAIQELHERLVAKHFPVERLRFLHLTAAPEDGEGLAIQADDLSSYREFKSYRKSGR